MDSRREPPKDPESLKAFLERVKFSFDSIKTSSKKLETVPKIPWDCIAKPATVGGESTSSATFHSSALTAPPTQFNPPSLDLAPHKVSAEASQAAAIDTSRDRKASSKAFVSRNAFGSSTELLPAHSGHVHIPRRTSSINPEAPEFSPRAPLTPSSATPITRRDKSSPIYGTTLSRLRTGLDPTSPSFIPSSPLTPRSSVSEQNLPTSLPISALPYTLRSSSLPFDAPSPSMAGPPPNSIRGGEGKGGLAASKYAPKELQATSRSESLRVGNQGGVDGMFSGLGSLRGSTTPGIRQSLSSGNVPPVSSGTVPQPLSSGAVPQPLPSGNFLQQIQPVQSQLNPKELAKLQSLKEHASKVIEANNELHAKLLKATATYHENQEFLQKDKNDLEHDLGCIHEATAKSEKEHAGAIKAAKELEGKRDKFQKKHDEISSNIASVVKQEENATKARDELVQKIAELRQKVVDFDQELGTYAENQRVLAKGMDGVRSQETDASKSLVAAKAKVDELAAEMDDLSKNAAKKQMILNAAVKAMHEEDEDIAKKTKVAQEFMLKMHVEAIGALVARAELLKQPLTDQMIKDELGTTDEVLDEFDRTATPRQRTAKALLAKCDDADTEDDFEIALKAVVKEKATTASNAAQTPVLSATKPTHKSHDSIGDLSSGMAAMTISGKNKAAPSGPKPSVSAVTQVTQAVDTKASTSSTKPSAVPTTSSEDTKALMSNTKPSVVSITNRDATNVSKTDAKSPIVPTTNITKLSGVQKETDTNVDRSKVKTKEQVFFAAWPNPEDRDGGPSEIRRLKVTGLPTTATLEHVASLIWGGKVQEIVFTSGSPTAEVLFLKAESALRYYNETSNGIEYPGQPSRFIIPELHADVDPVFAAVKSMIERSDTRVVRVSNFPPGVQWTIQGLGKVAAGKKGSLKVEKVLIGRDRHRNRVVLFRMGSIKDAIALKGELAQSPEWEATTVVTGEDPCETAKGVHYGQ